MVRVPTRLTIVSLLITPSISESSEALVLKFNRSAVTIPFKLYFELNVLVYNSSSFPYISNMVPSSSVKAPVGRGSTISVGNGVSVGSSVGSGVISPVGSGVISPSVPVGAGVTTGVGPLVGAGPSVGVTSSVGVGSSSFSGSTFPDTISIYVPREYPSVFFPFILAVI